MGSEYEVDWDTAKAIRVSLKNFLKQHPPGTELSTFAMGEQVKTVVTSHSKCPEDERLTCEVELQHKAFGGYANYSVDMDVIKGANGKIVITGADFPYPAEFIIAQKEMGIHVVEDQDWCLLKFDESSLTPVYCSKRRW